MNIAKRLIVFRVLRFSLFLLIAIPVVIPLAIALLVVVVGIVTALLFVGILYLILVGRKGIKITEENGSYRVSFSAEKATSS